MTGSEGTKVRRKFSPEEKFRIVKEALTIDISVSEICKKYGIYSTVFYNWQDKTRGQVLIIFGPIPHPWRTHLIGYLGFLSVKT